MEESARREAWRHMRSLSHSAERMQTVHQIFAEAGLTPGVGKALAWIPTDRAIPMRELAAALRCDNSYVTSVVDSLEERGVAERLPHPTDRRIKVVRLTDTGVTLAKRVQAEWSEPPASFESLSEEEATQLRDLLRKLTC